MFDKHINKKLSAYCNDELNAEERRDVELHLENCTRCKSEYEEIKFGVALAQTLPHADAPLDTWQEIKNRMREGETRGRGDSYFPSLIGWRKVLVACSVVLAVVCLGILIFRVTQNRKQPTNDNRALLQNSFEVDRLEGAPKVGTEEIKDTARLSVGEYLETDDKSKARIEIADIGNVEVAPNSRVKLVRTGETEHRLALDEGKLNADILAPPRLFVVDTPSAVAFDMGCKYTLEVDKEGNSFLHVTFGWVLLEGNEYESLVPAKAMCKTRKDKGVGTPYFEGASEKFVAALTKFDFGNGGTAALKIVIKESRDHDTLSLWHILPRVKGKDRELIFDALAKFMKPPYGVTREGILRLDPEMMDRWRHEIAFFWFPE